MSGPGSAALFQVEGLDDDVLLSLMGAVEGGLVPCTDEDLMTAEEEEG